MDNKNRIGFVSTRLGGTDGVSLETAKWSSVRQARAVLLDPGAAAEMVEHNYELGRRHYSYTSLEKRLAALLSEHFGED